MPPAYVPAATAPRLATCEPLVNLPALRVLADRFGDLDAPLRIVAPTYLDECAGCDEDPATLPSAADALVVYRLRGVVYREPVCVLHTGEVARWWALHGAHVLAVELPAPPAPPAAIAEAV